MKATSTISGALEDLFNEFQRLLSVIDDPPAREVLIYGPKDNQANFNPPGIYWVPGDESWTPPQRLGMPGFPRSLWVREVPITFEIFGGENPLEPEQLDDPATNLGDLDVSEALGIILANAFQRRLSQHGHQITGGSWSPGLQTGIGLVFVMRAVLRLPVIAIDNPTRRLTEIRTTVEITHEPQT